jgi:hypothetical protein
MPKTQSTSTKLSDTQLVILRAAAQRAEHSLLPFPESLGVKGATLGKVIETLCKRKLAEERRTIDGAAEWRRDEDGRALGLFITTNGLLALGVDDAVKNTSSQAAANMPRQRKTAPARPRRKAQKASSATAKRRTVPAQSKQDLARSAANAKPASGFSLANRIANSCRSVNPEVMTFDGAALSYLKVRPPSPSTPQF